MPRVLLLLPSPSSYARIVTLSTKACGPASQPTVLVTLPSAGELQAAKRRKVKAQKHKSAKALTQGQNLLQPALAVACKLFSEAGQALLQHTYVDFQILAKLGQDEVELLLPSAGVVGYRGGRVVGGPSYERAHPRQQEYNTTVLRG